MGALGGVLDAIAFSQLCAGDRKLAVRRAIEVSLLGAAALAQPVQYEDEADKLEVQQVALQVLGCKAVPKALTLLREDGHVDLAKRFQKLSRVRNRAAHPDGKAFVVALQQAYAGKTSDKDEGSVVDYQEMRNTWQEEKPKVNVEDGDKDNIEKAMQDTLKTKLGDIQEAEKRRAEDESTKEKVEEKNGLEKYYYAMRNTLQDEKLKEKSEVGDKENIDKAVKDIQEAEKYSAEDELTKDKGEAKDGIEEYCYAMRHLTLTEEQRMEHRWALLKKFDDGDKENIEGKQKERKGIIDPILTKWPPKQK